MSDGLAKIRAALDARPLSCSGTCEMPLKQSVSFYSTATSGAQYVTQYHNGDHELKTT